MSALDTQVGGGHYREGAIQPVQYIESNGLKFLEGCVVKRVTRHNRDGGKGRQDIEKAIHELQLLLEMRYPQLETTAQESLYAQPLRSVGMDKYAGHPVAAPSGLLPTRCAQCFSLVGECQCVISAPTPEVHDPYSRR